MLLTYFKTTFRAFEKDKKHFLLNLFGFAFGLSAALIVALFGTYELSYDQQHPNAERSYRVHTDYTSWGLQAVGTSNLSDAQQMLSDTRVEAVFGLREAEDMRHFSDPLVLDVQRGSERFRLNNAFVASSNILEFISLNVLAGDIEQTLAMPNYLAISETEARRLFGAVNALGETLQYEGGRYTIGAVFSDLPENTHFSFDVLAMIPKTLNRGLFGYVYMRLAEGADPDAIAELNTQIMRENSSERAKTLSRQLYPLTSLHFNSSSPFEMKQGGSSSVITVCILLTCLLLFIATVNFINLNIAAAAKRAKEVGVRKALGASKTQLVTQFMLESLVLVVLSSLVAFALAELSLPWVNTLLARNLSLSFSIPLIVSSIVVVLLVGLLAGIYPALFIASFSAKRVLSGDLQRGRTAIFVRKLTLTIQAGLSATLMIAAVILMQQLNLINNLELGYEKSQRITVKRLPAETVFHQQDNGFMRQLKAIPGIQQVTLSDTLLTVDMVGELRLVWPNGERISTTQPSIATGFNAVDTLGLELVAGRDFDPQYSSDWAHTDDEGQERFAILITEQLATLAGYSDPTELLGVTMASQRYNGLATVVGIVKDVKIGSIRQTALPLSFAAGRIGDYPTSNIIIRATPEADLNQIMRQVRELIRTELHVSNIEVSTVERDYYLAHKAENKIKILLSLFSVLAIFLTCLGIFGLASFSALRRQKEISMRKVLGASRTSLVNLLASEFLKLTLLGVALALPLCFLGIEHWLTNFNQRVEQSLWVYCLSIIMICSITWLTVASLAFKAASKRPSTILRYE